MTRLHVRRWWYLPLFAFHTQRSASQVRGSSGFLGGRFATEPIFGFWTITVWAGDQAMRNFRNTAAHLKAMPKLLNWCDEASYVHWRQEDSDIPSVPEVFKRMREDGKLSKVRHPSAAHAAGRTAADKEPKGAGLI